MRKRFLLSPLPPDPFLCPLKVFVEMSIGYEDLSEQWSGLKITGNRM